jgi:hypothetical protein
MALERANRVALGDAEISMGLVLTHGPVLSGALLLSVSLEPLDDSRRQEIDLGTQDRSEDSDGGTEGTHRRRAVVSTAEKVQQESPRSPRSGVRGV